MKFTKEQHIKRHTLKEDTYNEKCEFCNPELKRWVFDHGGECISCHAVGVTELNKANICYGCFEEGRK